MNCPVCNAKIRPTDEFCDNCGAVLAGATAAAVSSRTQARAAGPPPVSASGSASAARPGSKICQNCGTSNPSQEDFCTNCGANLNQPLVTPPPVPVSGSTNGAAPGASIKCPRCNNLIASNDKFCRKCGYSTSNLSFSGRSTANGSIDNHGFVQSLKIGVGTKLGDKGRYNITRQIGSGGMGAVFLAEDTVLKRKVVIKALLQSDDPDLVQASIKEREFLAAIKHPNVVQIYDFLQIDTDGYIVMEFVNGKTLFALMEDRGQPFSPEEAIRYILGILPAFAYMHRLGLVYCDFKPQNIMLEDHKDGSKSVKLIDLGTVIKYEKNPAAVYGTQGFYAPEAVKNPSPETDLYTIARSLAYMVSLMDLDRPQFGMPPAEHYRIFRDTPVLYRFLVKATNPIAARRFTTVEAMADQLEGVLRVVAGGQPGIPLSSKLFDSIALATGKLGTKEMASLDEKDKAFDLLKQGDIALRASQYNQALGYYNQAVGVNRNSVDGHLRLAEFYMERDQFSQALAEITIVQKIDPNNWKIAWYTGRLLESQGNLPAALDQYRELVQDLPGEIPPLLALARVHARLGNQRDAVEIYNLVAKASPDNTDALFGSAEGLIAQQQYKLAAETLARVNESSARYLDAQQAICNLYLYKKPQTDAGDLAQVSTALRNLQMRGTESTSFLLARADFYRKIYELAARQAMPPQFSFPEQDPDAPGNQAVPTRRQLAMQAEANYDQYLKRLPPQNPDREKIVRQKFKVAPWRLF
ncbi:MAG: tetratricopeptide repeat protein [Chloroflexi bacterium]|jgi:serine/threonine-protein kinase PknG|nr:tetratricopeptide repeat protein [Chloroflexota bacterium]